MLVMPTNQRSGNQWRAIPMRLTMIALMTMSPFGVGASTNDNEPGITEPGVPEAGGTAPDFLLMDLEQKPIRLSGFRGQPVIMNFFASWCGPCLKELPMIQEASLEAADRGFIVLGIGYQDSRWAIEDLAEGFGLTFPIVIDGDNSVGRAYRVIGPPYTFFIDADGVVIEVVPGEMDLETMNNNLGKLLNGSKADAA